MQVELHWSPSEPQHTGLIGIWACDQVPTAGELIWIEEPDLRLRLRVTSVRWRLSDEHPRQTVWINVQSLVGAEDL